MRDDRCILTPMHLGILFIACFCLVCASLVHAQPEPTKASETQTAEVITRLETTIANRNRVVAEDALAELEQLMPGDARLLTLKEKVAGLPGTKKNMTLDLGDGVTMEFVLIRPSSFEMGSNKATTSKPVHKVTISRPFYIGVYEVTQEQWKAVMGDNPSYFKGTRNPVEKVNWDDCQKFFAKLQTQFPDQTFRLPTEAEWEFACRAGTHTDYSFGDSTELLGEYAWYAGNSSWTTHPVGQKKPNSWGLYDMHGNVREWCEDWYADYSANDQTDPQGPTSGQNRVLRGGASNTEAPPLRSASRFCNYQGARYSYIGLRVVLVPKSP